MKCFPTLFVFMAIFAVGESMVCFNGICDRLAKRLPLQCSGSVIKGGGFCGCYDVCAKLEGDTCQSSFIRGRLPLGTCDKGLSCQHQEHMIIGAGKCVKSTESNTSSKRETRTLCEQRRISSMISMVVYKGQWFAKCDAEGLFMAEQCDNTGMCFCVDVDTGVVDQTTKVQGSANCETK